MRAHTAFASTLCRLSKAVSAPFPASHRTPKPHGNSDGSEAGCPLGPEKGHRRILRRMVHRVGGSMHPPARGLPRTRIPPPRKCPRKVVWISLADQKRGLDGVLWYQDMSRVCPECPQTTPREARDASCIRKAYGEHAGAKEEGRRKNAGMRRKATQSHPKAN
jgi:hypothetical protein